MLVAALVLLGSACSYGARSSDASAAPGTTSAGATAPSTTIDLEELCVHTDPGRQPISVHRAVNCPSGTEVSVQGILVRTADGSIVLCDAVSPSTANACQGDGLTVSGASQSPAPKPVGTTKVVYTGTVSGGVLSRPSAPLRSE